MDTKNNLEEDILFISLDHFQLFVKIQVNGILKYISVVCFPDRGYPQNEILQLFNLYVHVGTVSITFSRNNLNTVYSVTSLLFKGVITAFRHTLYI